MYPLARRYAYLAAEDNLDELHNGIRAVEEALRIVGAVQSLEGAELDEVQRLLTKSLTHLRLAARKLRSAR